MGLHEKILVLGISHKKDISGTRESPALDIIRLLQEEGASVPCSDPYSPELKLDCGLLRSMNLNPENLRSFDCVVVAADRRAFDYEMIAREASLIVDCRNAIPKRAGNVVRI